MSQISQCNQSGGLTLTAIECITAILQIALGCLLELTLLRRLVGYSPRKSKLPMIIMSVTALALLVVTFLFISDRETAIGIPDVVSMLTYIILPYASLVFKRKATFLLFGLIFASTADFIVFIVTSLSGHSTMLFENMTYLVLFLVLYLVLLFHLHFGKHYIPSNFFESIPPFVYVVVLVADYSSYYGAMLTFDETLFKDVSQGLMLCSALLVTSCLAYIVCKYFSVSQKEAKHQLELQLKHYESMIEANRDIRSFRHDITNNLFSLDILLCESRLDEAREYIGKLNGKIADTKKNKFYTGNYLADAIFADKAATAEQSGISVDFSGTIPQEGIENYDLCTILSNALDNAIDACREIAPCTIKIRANETEMGFFLKISNPTKNKLHVKNNKLKTTKADKSNHGFGLKNIEGVVKKYNGIINLSCEDKIFTLEASMILKEKIH